MKGSLMRKLTLLALCVVLSGESNAGPHAGEGTGAGPTRLVVELTEGSRFIGTVEIETLPFIATYAEMDLAMKEVDSVTLGEDKETAKVTMRNGDSLQGVVDIGELKLLTLLGEISVPVQHISRIAAARGPINRGLVLYYSFDEKGEIARDLSGKGNHGTVQGAKWVEAGRFGGARSFSGNRELVIAKDPLPVMTTMSVSLWFKSLGAAATTQVLICKSEPGHWCDGKWMLSFSNGRVDASTHHSGREPKQSGVTYKGISPTDGKWHHVVLTIDDKEESLYFDGQKCPDTVLHPLATSRHAQAIKIGGREYKHQYFRGLIDEVMVFNRALSAKEVQFLWKSS